MYKAPWQRWIGSEAGRNNKKRYTQTQYKNIDKNKIRPQDKDWTTGITWYDNENRQHRLKQTRMQYICDSNGKAKTKRQENV